MSNRRSIALTVDADLMEALVLALRKASVRLSGPDGCLVMVAPGERFYWAAALGALAAVSGCPVVEAGTELPESRFHPDAIEE